MFKFLGIVAAASFAVTPCLAAPAEVYGAMTMAQLAKVLTDVRGIPAEVKSSNGQDYVLIDAQVYHQTGHIQINGILCDSSAPPACKALAVVEPLAAPSSAFSDTQLLALQDNFDFINVHRLDANRLAVSMPLVLAGGVTAEAIDNGLAFFSGQYDQVKSEVAKQLPAQAPAPAKPK